MIDKMTEKDHRKQRILKAIKGFEQGQKRSKTGRLGGGSARTHKTELKQGVSYGKL